MDLVTFWQKQQAQAAVIMQSGINNQENLLSGVGINQLRLSQSIFSRSGMRALDADETAAVAGRLMTENRELRDRITALEIQNADLVRQAMQNMLAVDVSFVSAAAAEPVPQSEADRIWDEVCKAALT